jgi:hypothetical protein
VTGKTDVNAPKESVVKRASDMVDEAFPGRTTLYPHEVAHSMAISEQQVRDLIALGSLHAINFGKADRKAWRIPVAELKRFIDERSSLA